MSNRTLWKIKIDVHQIYNLRLPGSDELPDPYIAASLELPRTARNSFPVQRSASKSKTSSGTFNAVMLFIANIYDFDFDKVKLSVRVHNGRTLTELLSSDGSLIGSTTFSLSKVYAQAKHWIPREWVAITSEASPGETRGYINVSVGVFGPGDDVPSQLNDFQIGTESKEVISKSIIEKIVQTPETDFNNCMLIFNVLRAENLPVLNSRGQMLPCSPYVRVSFVGHFECTRVIQSNSNPAWNESVRIPVLHPTWDQWVVVDVFSRSNPKGPAIPESDILLGSAVFDFSILYKTGIQPTWFNIYSSTTGKNPVFTSLFGGEYSGRVLISASVSRSSDVNASVVALDASSFVEPATEELVVYMDIYELSFQDEAIKESEIPPEVWVQVQFGPNIFESERIVDSNMTCIFGESMGRLDPIRVHLPVDRAMAYDMVLSVIGQNADGSRRRICHARLNVDRFTVSKLSAQVQSAVTTEKTISADPEWLRLSVVSAPDSEGITGALRGFMSGIIESSGSANEDDRLVTVATLLANVTAYKISKGQFPDRPERITYQMASYELRISVHQACNIAISPQAQAFGELSSTCCRVTLAGASARTHVVPHTLFPVWNEGLRIAVDLPSSQSLRPDVLIEVIEESSGLVLGIAAMKSSTLRSTWSGSPAWYRLSSAMKLSGLGVQQESFILCSALLVSEQEGFDKVPIPSAIPQRGAFSVDLLIVGVRLLRNFSIERLNQLEVSWGRHRDKPLKRVVSIRTEDPVAGEGGQFNFIQPALLDLDLPIDSTFQEYLEVRLFEQVEESSPQEAIADAAAHWWTNMVNQQETKSPNLAGKHTSDRAIGFGFMHLNPHYAWISDAERKQYRDLFRMKTVEELRQADEAKAGSANAEVSEADKLRRRIKRSKPPVSNKRASTKDLRELEYMENEIETFYGISIAEENCFDLLPDFFDSVETESLLPAGFRARKPHGRRSRTASRILGGPAPAAVGTTNLSPSSSSAAVVEAAFDHAAGSKFMSSFVWEPLVSRDKSDAARSMLDTALESQLDPEQLPFISVPLVAPTPSGTGESFQVVGYLKVRCRVREKSADSSELISLQKSFLEQYEQSTRLVCRLYMLRAEGIVPSQAAGAASGEAVLQDQSSSYYLWIRNVVGALIAEYPNCSIKDEGDGTNRLISLNPEFSKCFQLPCSLPENSMLHIELYERRAAVMIASRFTADSAFTDTLIGTATVDLEDRWFHPAFQLLAALDGQRSKVPIETWTLRSNDGIPKGKIRFWLEIMDQVTAMGRAIETLPSPQSEALQVRIVLWRTRAVVNAPDEEHCHQGISAFMQDLPQQDSDTHYGSMDGSGTFNWRFVFNAKVPSDDTSIRFSLQHRPLTSIAGLGYVALGEVTLDLNQELNHVRKSRRAIDLPRAWVPLSHPAFIGKIRGMIEIQIRIITSEEARSFPVGVGREEPNTDPFLDASDPHLLQHRNALANTSIGRSFAKFVDAMRSGLRWATILFIIGSVISSIVALIVFLSYIGVIKVQ